MRRPLSKILPLLGALALAMTVIAAPPQTPSNDEPVDRPAPSAGAFAETDGLRPRSAASRSPSNADYQLRATLDVANHQIQGSGTLRWRNTSGVPATELRFHLYWNAWRDQYSSYAREATLARSPIDTVDEHDRASIDLTGLALRRAAAPDGQPADLLPDVQFIAPDDGNTADRTVATVPLDRPIQPEETVLIDVAWVAHVPRPFDRTGVIGNYFFIAQWFPKIGVLDANGWQARQFHMTTEYFADFGEYDVHVTVPSAWIVGATGREVAKREHDNGTTTHEYLARDVHDFAWTTSPDFIDLRQEMPLPGRTPISLRLLLQPEHRSQADRHWAAVRLALERYGEWFGPYAYDQLTVVDPVTVVDASVQGSSTGGMEYPQLITAGTRWTVPWASNWPDDVIVHEVGHQYFHTVVASNEVDAAWMDEGLTTYAASRLMAEAYRGRFTRTARLFGGLVLWPYEEARWTRSVDGDGANRYRAEPDRNVPSDPSWQFDPVTGRTLTYFRTTLWLHTLERMLGWETMRRALATYYARYAFRHPTPSDFFQTVSDVSGTDLSWFFDAVQHQATTFDYGVSRVTTVPVENGSFDTVVVVRRFGTGVFPIDVRVTFEDGSSITERWDGRSPAHTVTYRRSVRVRLVEIDPDRVLRLDVRQVNNSWTSRPQGRAAGARWGLRWFTWLEHQLLTYAFFI